MPKDGHPPSVGSSKMVKFAYPVILRIRTGSLALHLVGKYIIPGSSFSRKFKGTLPETNSSHLKLGRAPKRKVVFQLSIFRGYVSFREGTP